jgi:hypothetical protein
MCGNKPLVKHGRRAGRASTACISKEQEIYFPFLSRQPWPGRLAAEKQWGAIPPGGSTLRGKPPARLQQFQSILTRSRLQLPVVLFAVVFAVFAQRGVRHGWYNTYGVSVLACI